MKNEKGLESANVAFSLCVATKYSVAKNVGRECQESSVPFPDLAGALGLCLSFSVQKLCSAFHSEQEEQPKILEAAQVQ